MDFDSRDPFAPLTTQMLPVGDGHELYVETVGNTAGKPAVYLHGGPGSGCQPSHRRLFDPTKYHTVLFDQRGAGRSIPARSRMANTTQHLIADMELIRESLGFESWLVVGGSWGATLALAYAEAHPDRVTGLVLRATFLGTGAEVEQAFGETMRTIYPALHQDFLSVLPEAERDDPLPNYYRRILDADPAIHRPAAMAWHDTERALSAIRPPATRLDMAAVRAGSGALPSSPFMEAHYFDNDCFMRPNQLMEEAGRLKGIPGVIVQGRFDLLCPPRNSAALAGVWTDARIEMVEAAGHSLSEPAVQQAVEAAIRSFA